MRQRPTFRERVDALLARLGCFDWEIRVDNDYDEEIFLWVGKTNKVVDTYHPEKILPRFGEGVRIASAMSDNEICLRVLIALMTLDQHELIEGFKLDGVPFIDPHFRTPEQENLWDFSKRGRVIDEQEIALLPQLEKLRKMHDLARAQSAS